MIHALGSPTADDDVVVVGIQAWGRIVVHEWGWRAQFARIVAISDQLPSRVLRDMAGHVIEVRWKRGIGREDAQQLAQTYHGTLIDLPAMPTLLAQFGRFIDG